MFCYQCQETSKNEGCTIKGVCGKTADVANMQDLLIYLCKGISHYTVRLRANGVEVLQINKFIVDSLFMTITNANFDINRFIVRTHIAYEMRNAAKKKLQDLGVNIDDITYSGAHWIGETQEAMIEKALEVGVLATENEDVRSLRELIIYGLKGMAAYAEHAFNLGYEDNKIYAFIQQALVDTTNDNLSADELTQLVLKTGKYGVKVMALLDSANTGSYGNPEITKVNIGVGKNPGILISGHDLKDMEELLKQTEGTGVDIYTHSEMLPANYYPAFKKYSHFVGNYGGAWWQQTKDFETFNGVILFTTNCIVPPLRSSTYADKVYTTGASGFEGFMHIADREDGKPKDFSSLIEHAKKCKAPIEIETGEIIGGFAHNQVAALSDKVVDAVQTGAIRKFFVMGGCDGRMKGRNYYTEFAQEVIGLNGIEVLHDPRDNRWILQAEKEESPSWRRRRSSGNKYKKQALRQKISDWGTDKRGPNEILEAVLNNMQLKIVVPATKDHPSYTDEESTAKVNEIAKNMRDRFKSWVWEDAERAGDLLEIYNKNYNNLVGRKFDGAHLSLPGVSLQFKLHAHQKRAIWRLIQTGNTYLA
ncbi:MAG: hydroxylamine reductase, partial [Dysgonamonadaceae bacterium]